MTGVQTCALPISDWEAVDQIASAISYRVWSRYKQYTYFDANDVKQECLEWCLRRPDKLAEWLDETQSKDDYKQSVKKLGKTLSRHADKYCRKQKALALGYELRDEFFYDTATLEELLPHVWTAVIPTVDSTGAKVSGGSNPAEGGNYLASIVDVRRAIQKLDPSDATILHMKFFENHTLAHIAEELEVSQATAHRRVSSAIRSLQRNLGGVSPYL